MTIPVSAPSLILLIGPSGSGKSTFARRHFLPTEIISSDHCRALVSDDEADQSVSKGAFEILHLIAAHRLAAGKLAVIDATNVQPPARASLMALAQQHNATIAAIVFDLGLEACLERNARRPNRCLDREVIEFQQNELETSLKQLPEEGFASIHVLTTPEQIDHVAIQRT